jgi:predicted ATP-grasp superfamily ATP-dependent carboligase
VKLVLFADRDLRAPDPGWWPAGLVRDVPHRGEAIARGAPLCTLVSTGDGPDELRGRGARLLATLPDRAAAHV